MISPNGSHGETVVAVDAMGGDYAPDEVVQGALEARRLGARVVLVGCADAVEGRLQALGETLPLAPAPDVIGMDEPVTSALRRRQSSLKVAADLVAQGEADAVVSCGNSAAIYFFAYSIWGTQPGIDRPAFGGMLMTRGGPVFLLDIGANTSVKSSNLVQFAIMGDTYMRVSRGLTAPRIGLLSNGTEDSKGTKEVKEANQCLRRLGDMNFVGNVEGSQIFEGVADVVVCDGFAGNVLLKGGEAVAAEIFDLLRAEVSKGLISRIAAAALRPAFRRIKRQLDYEEYGGAPVLGVNGVMVNCHGRSRAKAVTNAILLAQQMAREGLVDRIGEALYQENVQSVGTTRRIARALHLRHAD